MLVFMKSIGMTWVLAFCAMGCSLKDPSPGLVDTLELGTVRGFHFERVITHLHTPYSHDACDGKGIQEDGSLNLRCLHDLKNALCENRINLAFNTDHVNYLAQTDFEKLLLIENGDTVVNNGSGNPVANALNCSNGFHAVMAPGLEGQLIALGMEKHVDGTIDQRKAVYGGESLLEKNQLEDSAGPNALVVVPHTESKSLDLLRSLSPEAMEIYNLHANLDPKIRKAYLGYKPFEHVAKFMNYLFDLFNSQNPDYLFVEFFQMSPLYFQKWNTLLSEDREVTGVAAHDSHENIFSQKAADGERLDQHRRMTRMFSNLVLTQTGGMDAIKDSIRNGRVYFVLEGLGSPIGLDFHGTKNGSEIIEMGSTMNVLPGDTDELSFSQPSVIASFPGMDSDFKPSIYSELHRIDSSANETVVATVSEGTLIYRDPPAGHYRIHSYMVPLHLKDLVLKPSYAQKAYPWIISNTIKVQK
jgi:hypothetical protein